MPRKRKRKSAPSSASKASSSAKSNSALSNSSAPNTTQSCSSTSKQILQDYRKDTKPQHQVLTDDTETARKKRKVSEELGEKAAICANSLAKKKKETAADYQIFDGRDVFDLVQVDPKSKEVEVKEAKGGKSQYGTRKGLNKKPVKQCTLPYVNTIAEKMSKSNYKGSHCRVGCAKHIAKPDQKCKDCKAAERLRRRNTGNAVKTAAATGKLKRSEERRVGKEC